MELNKTLEIKIYEEIRISDVFCYIKKIITKVKEFINKIFNTIVIQNLFNDISNYSNPPNKLIRTKLDKSLKDFDLLLFFTIK